MKDTGYELRDIAITSNIRRAEHKKERTKTESNTRLSRKWAIGGTGIASWKPCWMLSGIYSMVHGCLASTQVKTVSR